MPCRRASEWTGREFSSPGAETHYAPDLGLEPVHLDVELSFDLEARSAMGSVTTTVVSRVPGRRTLELDAVDLLDLSVKAPDGERIRSSYEGNKVRITWETAPLVGEQRRVEVRYRVEDPLTGMMFSGPDEAYPERARFVATDHETERARFWLPCVDHPTVRTTLDLRLRAPAGLTILSNGFLVEETAHDDGSKTAHWRLEQPCPSYLVCLAIGEFACHQAGEFEGRPVAYFAPAPYTPADLERSFGRTIDMLGWMTQKLAAPFPYPKYYQLAIPQIGGAMENISLVTWDDAFLLDEELAKEFTRMVDRINVHEMAHSYFGDAIVIRDFAHAWLKESWATYVESLWVEDTLGREELLYQLHLEARDYQKESDSRYARPIVTRRFDSSWDMFDQHLYPGGAWRIHMLREKVGQEAFWAAVRDYVDSYMGRVVETDDFRRMLEKHSGLSLGRFFDQWLRSPGYPQLKLEFSYDDEKGEGKLVLEQKQVSSEKGIGTFEFELELAVEASEGAWETRRLEIREAKHSFVQPLAARPLQLVIDPESKLLHSLEFDPGRDMLLRSLSSCPHLPGRLHAIKTLGKAASRNNVSALKEAALAAEFWGVRAAIASALGDAQSQAAAEALPELLLAEKDPLVLIEWVLACRSYRDPAVAQGLRAFLETNPPYRARAMAYTALGAQRQEEDLEALEAGVRDRSWWGWVRRGALAGLSQSRSPRALASLRERASYGGDAPQVRLGAIEGLASLGRWLEPGPRREIADLLVDLARDPEYRARTTVARALATLAEPSTLGAFAGVARGVAAQDRPRIWRLLEQARQGTSAGGSAEKLEKRLEDLEGKLRGLEDRLQLAEDRGKRS